MKGLMRSGDELVGYTTQGTYYNDDRLAMGFPFNNLSYTGDALYGAY